jgi:hypothetical protein
VCGLRLPVSSGGSGRERRGEAGFVVPCVPTRSPVRRGRSTPLVPRIFRPRRASGSHGPSTGGVLSSRGIAGGRGKVSRPLSATRVIAWEYLPVGRTPFVSGRATAGGRGRPAAFPRCSRTACWALPVGLGPCPSRREGRHSRFRPGVPPRRSRFGAGSVGSPPLGRRGVKRLGGFPLFGRRARPAPPTGSERTVVHASRTKAHP